jgi:outer membrane protein assembly factor BamE
MREYVMSNRCLNVFLTIAIVTLIAGCSALTPYKLPIQQGNIVSNESLAKLKSGMSKNQTAQILGTPLLNDVFHANRWDYVHYLNKRGKMSEQNHIALIFEEEKLARLVGEGAPTLAPMAEPELPAAAPSEPDTKQPPEPTETK